MAAKTTVFLFKSPKENEVDKFSKKLEQEGLVCSSIPVLSFRFVNQEALKSDICTIHLFSAIIFTSVRAVEAVANALQGIQDSVNFWKVQSFAVGHTTVEAARKAGFNPKGENSGNSQALGEYILQQADSEDNKPYLYPCSNLHRDALKEILTSHGKSIKEVVSYETCPNEGLKDAVEKAVEQQGLPDYAVFFSPSGFHFTLDIIDESLMSLNRVKIVAIGPTTKKAVCDKGYLPFATAERPDPQSLLDALLKNGLPN